MKTSIFNKIKILVNFILILAVSISCSLNNGVNNNQAVNNTKNLDSDCSGVSTETAVYIAKGMLYRDYKLTDFEVEVETETVLWQDREEMWKVSFKKKEKLGTFGPEVWLYKRTGERFTVRHSK